MNANDILTWRSDEILNLFHTIERIQANIDEYESTHQKVWTEDPLLDNKEVCKLLQISPRTLQEYRDKQIIAYYKLEGKILFKLSDIQRLLTKNYYDVRKLKR